MMFTNILHRLRGRRLFTYKVLSDQKQNIGGSQIDVILINERYNKSIKSGKANAETDVSSDHNTLIA